MKRKRSRKNPDEMDDFASFKARSIQLNPYKIKIEEEFRRRGKTPNYEGLEEVQRGIFRDLFRGRIDDEEALMLLANAIAAFTKHGPVDGFGV